MSLPNIKSKRMTIDVDVGLQREVRKIDDLENDQSGKLGFIQRFMFELERGKLQMETAREIARLVATGKLEISKSHVDHIVTIAKAQINTASAEQIQELLTLAVRTTSNAVKVLTFQVIDRREHNYEDLHEKKERIRERLSEGVYDTADAKQLMELAEEDVARLMRLDSALTERACTHVVQLANGIFDRASNGVADAQD